MEAERPSHAIFREDEPSDAEPIPAATQKLEAVTQPPRTKDRHKLRRKLRGDLDMILLKALRKEPERRYISVEQFSEDIGRYLSGQPVIARKDTVGYRSAKFVWRHKAGVAAAGVALAALIGASVSSIYSVRAVRAERARAERGLIDADLRIGDLERGLGDLPSARQSYRSALSVAHARLQVDPLDGALTAAAARAERSLGELLEREGNRFEALDHCREAVKIAEPAGGKEFLAALEKEGALEAELDDNAAALATNRRYLQAAEKTSGAQADVALAHDRVGRLLPGAEGIADLSRAAELFRQLPTERAGLARALADLADAYARSGNNSGAIASYRESLGLSPLPDAEAGLAAVLLHAGQTAEARVAAKKAIDEAQERADRAGAGEAEARTAVRILLDTPFADLRNAALAQRYALKAMSLTKESDPVTLDLLAQVYAASGLGTGAISTESKALALLPSGQPSLRARLEQNLAAFRQGLAKGAH
jgi:tetratricopeptide (TPR) repeat protein